MIIALSKKIPQFPSLHILGHFPNSGTILSIRLSASPFLCSKDITRTPSCKIITKILTFIQSITPKYSPFQQQIFSALFNIINFIKFPLIRRIFGVQCYNCQFQMGNDTIINEKGLQNAEKVATLELTHIGATTLLRWQDKQCLLKIFSFSDSFLMEQCLRRLKTRSSKLSNSPHVLAVYQVSKQEKKELCANNYQLHVYLQHFDFTLAQLIEKQLEQRRNFTEEQLYSFLGKAVDSLIYIQDNGLKNIQLDVQAVLFSGQQIKVLDNSVASSKTYYQLLDEREKAISNSEHRVYLAPQLLKDLKELNYDPYISPKADIFSLGMLLLQMVTLQPMRGYYNYSCATMDYESLIHRLSRISHSLPLKTLLAEMLQHDPQERIGLVSLRQKLQKLRNSANPKQSIARSKSSKMLKEILSHSRRSGSASKQAEVTSRQQSYYGKSFDLHGSRRRSDQFSVKQHSQQIPKQRSIQSSVHKELSRRDSVLQQHLQNNLGNAQFKNIVKNRLFRQKNKQNPSKAINESVKTKFSSHYNTGGKLIKDATKVGIALQTRNLLEANKGYQTSKNNQKVSSSRSGKLQFNQYESNHPNRQFQSSTASNALDQSVDAKGGLSKLVEVSGMKSLLRLQQLDTNNLHRIGDESAKNTSRFGVYQYNHPPLQDVNNISSDSFIPIPAEQQSKSEMGFKQSKEKEIQNRQSARLTYRQESGREKLSNKTLSFNHKQFFLNAKSVQKSLQMQRGVNNQQKFVFSPIPSTTRQKPNSSVYRNYESCEIEQSPHTITIKNIPVVISQQKTLMAGANYGRNNFGKLQRQLELIDCVQSIEQDSPSSDSMINTSNVIQTFKPNDSFRKQQREDRQQQSCFLKKRKGKKPNLNIQINDDKQNDEHQEYRQQEPIFNNYESNQNYLIKQQQVGHKEQNQLKTFDYQQSSKFNSCSASEDLYYNYNISKIKSQTATQKEGIKHQLTLPNGDIYVGQLNSDHKITGVGELYSQGRLKYHGSFKNGQFHGFGQLYNLEHRALPVDYKNIDLSKSYWVKYEGEFEQGLKNKFGTVYFANHEKYSGYLKKQVIDGLGCFYSRSGQLINGNWSQNCLTALSG